MIDPTTVETNIVRFRLDGLHAGHFVDDLCERGVWMLPSGPDGVHAVFYLDLTDTQVDEALTAIRAAAANAKRHESTPSITALLSRGGRSARDVQKVQHTRRAWWLVMTPPKQ
ncbi:hypothetical protein IC607_04540 [Cellulomonas sp. JH27-2]|uniref:hypothetical protein n=1 Tax=Cellulomonas sp. JH27-2 TaxID=2774139 RepID=UPI0017844461|nr:hypothetical protein [Cellulomonas sp. JH27-2]MBD8058237.1 hypothetical protein [Cellulomonas sp. JH27-2]